MKQEKNWKGFVNLLKERSLKMSKNQKDMIVLILGDDPGSSILFDRLNVSEINSLFICIEGKLTRPMYESIGRCKSEREKLSKRHLLEKLISLHCEWWLAYFCKYTIRKPNEGPGEPYLVSQ